MKIYQNLWNTAKPGLKGNFVRLSASIRKEKKYPITSS